MSTLMMRITVQDFGKWKSVFDEAVKTRGTFGSTGGHVYRSKMNPKEIVVISEWEDEKKALAWTKSEELKAFQKRGGVVKNEEILTLEEIK
jgi:heme-degrading monooxygenase HmoA